jgi:outer membrane protein assembly factor BamB
VGRNFPPPGILLWPVSSLPSPSNALPTGKILTGWSEFHRSNMERRNPYETTLNVDNVGRLGLKWHFATGGGFSSPAVVNGVVYIGAGNRNVYSLNAKTGAKLSSYTNGGVVDFSPAVANGVLYGTGYASNAKTGAVVWDQPHGCSVATSPALAYGMAYVAGPLMFAV